MAWHLLNKSYTHDFLAQVQVPCETLFNRIDLINFYGIIAKLRRTANGETK